MQTDSRDFDFPCSPTWRAFYNERYGYPGIDYNPYPQRERDTEVDMSEVPKAVDKLATKVAGLERIVWALKAEVKASKVAKKNTQEPRFDLQSETTETGETSSI